MTRADVAPVFTKHASGGRQSTFLTWYFTVTGLSEAGSRGLLISSLGLVFYQHGILVVPLHKSVKSNFFYSLKTRETTGVGEDAEKRGPSCTVGGRQRGAAALENSLGWLKKVKKRTSP